MVDPNAIAAVLATLDRQTIAATCEMLHVILDWLDGDADREDDDPDTEHDGREPEEAA